jgi:hypothetical protein
MAETKKPTFWQRMFGGVSATMETPSVVADAQGVVSFSAEQFTALTSHLETLETEKAEMSAAMDKSATMVDGLSKKLDALELKATAHGERLDKIAKVPAMPVATTTVEPTAKTGDAAVAEVDPLDAELKALQNRF